MKSHEVTRNLSQKDEVGFRSKFCMAFVDRMQDDRSYPNLKFEIFSGRKIVVKLLVRSFVGALRTSFSKY